MERGENFLFLFLFFKKDVLGPCPLSPGDLGRMQPPLCSQRGTSMKAIRKLEACSMKQLEACMPSLKLEQLEETVSRIEVPGVCLICTLCL